MELWSTRSVDRFVHRPRIQHCILCAVQSPVALFLFGRSPPSPVTLSIDSPTKLPPVLSTLPDLSPGPLTELDPRCPAPLAPPAGWTPVVPLPSPLPRGPLPPLVVVNSLSPSRACPLSRSSCFLSVTPASTFSVSVCPLCATYLLDRAVRPGICTCSPLFHAPRPPVENAPVQPPCPPPPLRNPSPPLPVF